MRKLIIFPILSLVLISVIACQPQDKMGLVTIGVQWPSPSPSPTASGLKVNATTEDIPDGYGIVEILIK